MLLLAGLVAVIVVGLVAFVAFLFVANIALIIAWFSASTWLGGLAGALILRDRYGWFIGAPIGFLLGALALFLLGKQSDFNGRTRSASTHTKSKGRW